MRSLGFGWTVWVTSLHWGRLSSEDRLFWSSVDEDELFVCAVMLRNWRLVRSNCLSEVQCTDLHLVLAQQIYKSTLYFQSCN